MLQKLVSVCIAALFSSMVWANSVGLQPNAPEQYTVKKGDTLWDIAGIYLEKPWYWPSLWKKNPEIENPHLIYPGDLLRLIWKEGKPSLIKVSENTRSDQVPINGVPAAVMRQFLTFDTLIDDAALKRAPRVLGNQGGWQYISTRAPFYVDVPLTEKDWFVYRPSVVFEKEGFGQPQKMISLIQVGQAQLKQVDGALSEMQLVKQIQEVRPNDILLPKVEGKKGDVVEPKTAPDYVKGELIGHLYGSKYVGLRQIVVLDVGDKNGVKVGQVLSVKQSSAGLKGQKGDMRYETDVDNKAELLAVALPESEAGKVLVVRTYPHFSLAMVAEASQPLSAPMRVTATQ